jgi:hypothetical protein
MVAGLMWGTTAAAVASAVASFMVVLTAIVFPDMVNLQPWECVQIRIHGFGADKNSGLGIAAQQCVRGSTAADQSQSISSSTTNRLGRRAGSTSRNIFIPMVIMVSLCDFVGSVAIAFGFPEGALYVAPHNRPGSRRPAILCLQLTGSLLPRTVTTAVNPALRSIQSTQTTLTL